MNNFFYLPVLLVEAVASRVITRKILQYSLGWQVTMPETSAGRIMQG